MFRRVLIAAALLAGAAAPALAQGCDTRFVLRNESKVTVNEFYFGPSSQQDWGRDRLGDGVLPPGRAVTFNPGGRGGAYDFRVVWSTGEHAQVMRVNICQTSEIVATQDGIEAR